ncbi:FecR domain-containing protein [Novosphingobium sp. RD2P27]|uniref:FecR domain-containing protein n=1 Tax=Novosphingobium kalidii TaxID=3230299 RepID=A0ABV2CZE0_9SPHN
MIGAPATRFPRGLSPDEAAAFWLVQMDAGRLEGRLAAEFEQWLGIAPRHGEAFKRARETWNLFEGVGDEPSVAAIRHGALAAEPEHRSSGWKFVGAGAAATILGLMALATAILPAWRERLPVFVPAVRYERSDFATARGELREIELVDGSRITLNTDSAVRVAYSADRRLIAMLRGQALFEVAKNRRWPFVVEAGGRQITALGTVFDVRLEPDRVQVILAEGKVLVDSLKEHQEAGTAVAPVLLTPGEELIARKGRAAVTTKIDVERQLRWREGFAEFEEVPLATAVEEMNRYSTTPLVVDREAGELKVSGIFRTGSPHRFAAIVAELLPVRVRSLPEGSIQIVRGAPAGK